MTPGDPGQGAEAAADLRRAMSDVGDSIELIGLAEDKPDWVSPSARTRFNMSAWATRVSAEMAFIRLNRSLLALTKVRADHTTMTPIIPHTLATGDDSGGWIPQGLGYDPGSGMLLQTSYRGGDSQLSLVDPESGEQTGLVNLGAGVDEDRQSLGAPDHAGGVAVHDGSVFAMSSHHPPRLFEYSLKDVQAAAPGETVPVKGTPTQMPTDASAYSTIAGGKLDVGSFTSDPDTPGELHVFDWDARTREWAPFGNGPVPTPPQTQGVTVRGDDIVFSSSFGRDKPGFRRSYDRDSVLGLWASMHMTTTPYAELGLEGGVEVEPMTLHQASLSFDDAEAGLDASEKAIAAVDLPAGTLGDVPQGAAYGTALTQHCDTTAQWLDQGKIAAGVTSSGLVSSAAAYAESDALVDGLLRRLLPGLG